MRDGKRRQQLEWLAVLRLVMLLCSNGVAGAACALVGGVVKLKGCAQCSPNMRSCYDKPLQHFATLAAECMDARGGLYTLGPQTVNGPPTGAQISVDWRGRLALVKAAPNAWNLQLDGLVIPQVAAWGWTFIVLLFLAGAMSWSVAQRTTTRPSKCR